MKILHYSLGFPPYRTGGLTKFCMDLMKEQVRLGHEVALLWPGEIRLINRNIGIHKRKEVDGITSYEIINPIPVSYDEGIKDFRSFVILGDRKVYEKLINSFKPDVIHIHTLMGLHKSFIDVSKDYGIKLVFSAHDFFPICPKVTIFKDGKICECVENCKECGACNNSALSQKKIFVLQSPIYRTLKNNVVVKKMRKKHRDDFLSNNSITNNTNLSVGSPNDFIKLRQHYYKMLLEMDVIHYNSSITKKVYEKIYDLPKGKIINITHSDISDHRRIKSYNDQCIRIRYLGPQSDGKGFYILKKALDEIWKTRNDFRLDVHFSPKELAPYIIVNNRYSYGELENIFDHTDVLIAPSILYETFGYTVLEALSYGVPVIISGTVGAKDIINNNTGIIIEDISVEKIKECISKLNKKTLQDMNFAICNEIEICIEKKMAEQIEKECYLSI